MGFAIAGAVLTVLASAAAPPQPPNRIAANEASAIGALRRIAAAQERFKAAVDIDTNCDGVGEYGFLAELGGTKPMRVENGCTPAAGTHLLSPPVLRSALGTIELGCVEYHGYLFQMWLPDSIRAGIREDGTGGCAAAPFPDSATGAHLWCCYAWPIEYNHTGKRAFFINQRGAVLEYSNQGPLQFSGRTPYFDLPWFDEAYSVQNDMGSPVRIGIPNANGSIWRPVP
jgi:hypothetical protein